MLPPIKFTKEKEGKEIDPTDTPSIHSKETIEVPVDMTNGKQPSSHKKKVCHHVLSYSL